MFKFKIIFIFLIINFDIFSDLTLTKLATKFDSFSKDCMRKQNLLTSMMADILSEVRLLSSSIKELAVHKSSESTSLPENLHDKLTLPAKNIEDINEIEEYLAVPENFPKVVSVLENQLLVS